jgi:phosphate transport system substrate-binding protein
VARWILAFSEYYPRIVLNAEIVGSGIAGPCLSNSSCQLSIIGREVLLAEEAQFVSAWGYKPFEFPVAGGSYAALAYTDGMTVMVHPSNPLTKISFSEFDAVFSTTRNRRYTSDITKWGQFGLTGDWVNQDIRLYGVQIPNGFELFINRTILLGGKWKPNIITRPTVFELATLVSQDPYSMGYTGLAFLNATVNKLHLSQDGGWAYNVNENYVFPDKLDLCTRKYPLSRLIYLYTHKKPGQPLDPVIKEFLNFILSYEGQKAVQDDMIFLPLPLRVVKQLRKQLGLST